jgi:16S rRNA (adenine1518-N6/adenine1519-N6)-dimethyltransferase
MYKLKKSLGQHFLKDEGIAAKIVQAMPLKAGMNLLEVGPGAGALTRLLKDVPDMHFKALEIDQEKVSWLLSRYPDLQGRLEHGDILKAGPPFEGPFSVIGNFPYNISSQILLRVLEWRTRVPCMVGMFQREVARRIASGPGTKDYGILSVLTQAFYRVEYLFEVDKDCFTPPPQVTSAVIRLSYRGNPYGITDEKKFFTLVKTSFNQRRKMLRNPLKPFFSREMLGSPLFEKRAEDLDVAAFVSLSKQML